MLFNSLVFVVAFPLFCAVYFSVPARYQQGLLLAASVAACALAGWSSLAWLIAITLVGYAFGRRIARRPSTSQLVAAILIVLAPLVFLKYTNFILDTVRDLSERLGAAFYVPHLDVTLPLGLSFYTFVVIGYLVDVQLERVQAETRLDRFTLLTAFFPKFVAGPVERADHFLPQTIDAKAFDYARVTDGIRIMGWGFFLKLVVADRLALVVDAVYRNPDNYHGMVLVLTSVFYMFQVYYDFWAYSLIAVGAARILGYDLIWNFNRPYAARSVSDYWRRWHISLTTWFFDYVFWPINAALRGWKTGAVVVAMVVTFLVSGLWHGANWTFVLFGLAHSVAMTIEFLTAKRRKRWRAHVPPHLYGFVAWLATFVFLMFADILFRAASVTQAGQVMRNMVEGVGVDAAFLVSSNFSVAAFKGLIAGLPVLKIELVIAVAGIALVELVSYAGRHTPLRDRVAISPAPVRWAVYYAVSACILFLGAHNTTTAFLYVQF